MEKKVRNLTEEARKVADLLSTMEPTPSIRAIYVYASECGKNVSYQMILKAGKAPIPGEKYNPEAVNYMAIVEYLQRKLGADLLLETFDSKENLAKALSSATLNARVKIERPDLKIGDSVFLRKDTESYKVIFMNDAFTVLVPTKSKVRPPRVMNHATLEHQRVNAPAEASSHV